MANVSAIKLPDNITYNIKAGAIPYGEVDSTSTSTAYTATIPGINELKNGTIMLLRNGAVTSASGFTININGLGAKPVYNNLATGNTHTPTNPTRDTNIFNINYTMLFIYDEDLVSGGAWICYRGYDANTNTIGYQLRGNNGTRPAADKGYRYRLWLSSLDNQSWVPINTSTATDATTSRSLNSRVIDPFGEIVYYSTNGTTNANSNLTATTIWQQYALTIGYSYVKTLTAWDPVYLKCEPQTTGGAIMKDIVQALPNSADGFIYIYLGIAYSTTAMELRFYHPVYYHDGNGIRAWTGTKIPTKTSELTNDSGFITSYTETDPVFSASPAAGITSANITVWNNKSDFSGSYNDLTNKPDILDPNIIDAYARSEATELDADWLALNGRYNPALTPEEGKIYRLRNGSEHYIAGMVFRWTGLVYEPFFSYPVPSWTENDPSKPTYIEGKPSLLTALTGPTVTVTPTQVYEAIGDGRPISITIEDNTYGLLTFTTFCSSFGMSAVVANTSSEYNGALLLFTLLGLKANDVWNLSVTTVAKTSDLPTVPTNVSAFTNDVGYLTSYTETDPTVPAWAKASTKPSYTAEEVGALPTSGGQLTGDLTLYVASGNSPGIIFQRGALTDNYNDWKIYDKGGYLYFAQRGSGSTDFADMGYFNTSGQALFHVPWSYIDSKPTFATVATSGSYNDLSDTPPVLPTVSSSDNGKVLQVVNGAWAAVQLPSASGVSF